MRTTDSKSTASAVIFDMDGTLLATEALCRRAWQQAAGEMRREMPDSLYAEFIGRPNQEAIAMLADRWGETFDQSRYATRVEVLYQNIIEREGIALREGILDLLSFLKSKKIPMAVATSTNRNLAIRKLKLCRIIDFFSVVVGGDEVAHGKPDPDIFLLTSQRLNIAPADCLVFEDSPAGVKSACQAGMKCILIPDIAPAPEETVLLAWQQFKSARDVYSLFA